MKNEQKTLNSCEEFEILIDGYLDGEVMPDEKIKLEEHLIHCPECKEYMNDSAKILEKTAFLPKEFLLDRTKKDLLWKKIRQGIGANGNTYAISREAAESQTQISWFSRYRYVVASVSAAAVLFIAIFTVSRLMEDKQFTTTTGEISSSIQVGAYWKVANIKGTPVIDDVVMKIIDSIGIGQWITTNDTSSAELMVSNLGKVTLEPKSKVRIVNTAAGQQRMQVAYGTIDAKIDANPRSFFVDMPSVTAVDLGCSYKLTVDSSGNGLVYVTEGKVSLESAGRETVVPEGKFCITRKDIGPGTPFRGDASAKLKKALIDFDFGNCAGSCVNTILKNAKRTDAVTLVCILPRVEENMKGVVYAKVSGFVAPPKSFSYDTIPVPQIDNEKLQEWIEKIQDEVHDEIEKSMEQLRSDLEKMNKDMDNNSKDWEDYGKQWQKFGEELSITRLEKNFKWHKMPGIKDKYKDKDSAYFDKEQFKMDMEEMKKNMEEMKNEFDSKQFKQEMEQSKEEMQKSKEEMKRSQKELKESMKELKKNLRLEFENYDTINIKLNIIKLDGNYEYDQPDAPDVIKAPEAPETPETIRPETNVPETNEPETVQPKPDPNKDK
jgi:hypothetical protein